MAKENKIAALLAAGDISPEDLIGAKALVERAELVNAAMAKFPEKILFPLGTREVSCYDYTDRAGEYSSWGTCTIDGNFTCMCNWGGDHTNGICNLTDFSSVFNAFDTWNYPADLERFLKSMLQRE